LFSLSESLRETATRETSRNKTELDETKVFRGNTQNGGCTVLSGVPARLDNDGLKAHRLPRPLMWQDRGGKPEGLEETKPLKKREDATSKPEAGIQKSLDCLTIHIDAFKVDYVKSAMS